MFGRYQLLRLLGKSERTQAWMVAEPGRRGELLAVLPRVQPVGVAALERWTDAVHRGARAAHPNIAAAVEIGVQDGWPYALYDAGDAATLADRHAAKGQPATEVAALMAQAAAGLAFAHDGGIGYHDLQPYLLLVTDQGALRIAGLEVAADDRAGADHDTLRRQREAAERDVLALGIVMHQALVGQPALDEPDVGRVIDRLPPAGREIVRLPWTTAHPIPEPLRAIVNRASDRQERQRYRTARTLGRALEGWLQIEAGGTTGPLALLQDKLRAAGVLPSSPGAAARVARLALMERQRTDEIADVVLQDFALAFELLRAVNTAQFRGAQVSGNGPVLTVRRAIAMVGLDGVRRAALALRPWPGPLAADAATELERLVERVRRAGNVALALRPAGYDGEVVYLITLLQNLGRLVVQYHFADEAAQVRRLMQPGGDHDDAGMAEESAACAVLGSDIDAIGAAVARHWGLDDSVVQMIRRLPLAAPVRANDGDDDLLRQVASCANEAVDALALPAPQVAAALHRVVQRHGRALGIGPKDLQAALQGKPATEEADAGAAFGMTPHAAGGRRGAAVPAAGGQRADAAPLAGGQRSAATPAAGGLRSAAAARARERSQ